MISQTKYGHVLLLIPQKELCVTSHSMKGMFIRLTFIHSSMYVAFYFLSFHARDSTSARTVHGLGFTHSLKTLEDLNDQVRLWNELWYPGHQNTTSNPSKTFHNINF